MCVDTRYHETKKFRFFFVVLLFVLFFPLSYFMRCENAL